MRVWLPANANDRRWYSLTPDRFSVGCGAAPAFRRSSETCQGCVGASQKLHVSSVKVQQREEPSSGFIRSPGSRLAVVGDVISKQCIHVIADAVTEVGTNAAYRVEPRDKHIAVVIRQTD